VLQSFSEDGSIVWESKDILLELERRFPQSAPLMPTDEEEKQTVMDFMAELEECGLDKHGKHNVHPRTTVCWEREGTW
jgi:glutathione S-transferase